MLLGLIHQLLSPFIWCNVVYLQENNRSEIERLDIERKDEFVNMLKGFVSNQVLSGPHFIRCLELSMERNL